jgi:hypothetical protein
MKMILGFIQRACGDAQEVHELLRIVPAESLRRISRGGSSGISNLIAEFEILGDPRPGSNCKDLFLKSTCQLPGNQIFESSNTYEIRVSTNRTNDSRTLRTSANLVNPENLENLVL